MANQGGILKLVPVGIFIVLWFIPWIGWLVNIVWVGAIIWAMVAGDKYVDSIVDDQHANAQQAAGQLGSGYAFYGDDQTVPSDWEYAAMAGLDLLGSEYEDSQVGYLEMYQDGARYAPVVKGIVLFGILILIILLAVWFRV